MDKLSCRLLLVIVFLMVVLQIGLLPLEHLKELSSFLLAVTGLLGLLINRLSSPQ